MISALRTAAVRASTRVAVVGRAGALSGLRVPPTASPAVFTLRHFSNPPVRARTYKSSDSFL